MGVLVEPVITEKTVRLVQDENKITFIVERKATKIQIKREFERKYNVKVAKVNTLIMMNGKKKAYITLAPEEDAMSLAVRLGYF